MRRFVVGISALGAVWCTTVAFRAEDAHEGAWKVLWFGLLAFFNAGNASWLAFRELKGED